MHTKKNLVHRWLGSSGFSVGKNELAFCWLFFIVVMEKSLKKV